MKHLSEEMIIRNCAPTLAGIKTGNMFGCKYAHAEEMKCAVRKFNRLFAKKGIRVLPLKFDGKRALIYVYRPSRLNDDLRAEKARNVLQSCGYGEEKASECVVRLMRRMREAEDFPHEIGLFLGYPPDDVYGFINNRDDACKCVGYWRVYGDEEQAIRTFAKYRKCTEVYCRQYKNGRSIERLTVSEYFNTAVTSFVQNKSGSDMSVVARIT